MVKWVGRAETAVAQRRFTVSDALSYTYVAVCCWLSLKFQGFRRFVVVLVRRLLAWVKVEVDGRAFARFLSCRLVNFACGSASSKAAKNNRGRPLRRTVIGPFFHFFRSVATFVEGGGVVWVRLYHPSSYEV